MNSSRKLLEQLKIEKSHNLISLPQVELTFEEADRFIDYMVDESAMKKFARIERMRGPEKPIRALGFGSGHFLYPAGNFNESKYTKQFVDEKIMLMTKECRGAIPIFDKDLEDIPPTMSSDEYNNQLIKIIALKIQNELEEAGWISETAGLNGFADDDIRGLWDGWRYRITHSEVGQPYYNKVTGSAHILNACEGGEAGSPFEYDGKIAEADADYKHWEFKYGKMLKAMPSKYKMANGLEKMAFLNSDLVTQDYFDALSARPTPIGDGILTGNLPMGYGKVKIIDVPLMPVNLGDPTAVPSTDGIIGEGEYTDVLLTPKDNLIVGIQRDIKMESERKAADQATYIFYSLRIDFAIENVDAVVLLRCLEHAC
jgi:hypothetical protein